MDSREAAGALGVPYQTVSSGLLRSDADGIRRGAAAPVCTGQGRVADGLSAT